jgi:nucleoside phosphorylase
MNRENRSLCFVFAMGTEAYPFLQRVEVVSTRRAGTAVYRETFFEGSTFSIVRCGIGPERAAAAVRNLDCKPAAVISVGTAGALVEDLRFGDIVVARETVFGDSPGTIFTWSDELVEGLSASCSAGGINHRIVRLATVRAPVFTRECRLELHDLTGAHAVDMETHAMGVEAMRLGVPFAALRVISDDLTSPPLPVRPGRKHAWQGLSELPGLLLDAYRWRRFVVNFNRAVELLHPVLVRVIRDAKQSGKWICRGPRASSAGGRDFSMRD